MPFANPLEVLKAHQERNAFSAVERFDQAAKAMSGDDFEWHPCLSQKDKVIILTIVMEEVPMTRKDVLARFDAQDHKSVSRHIDKMIKKKKLQVKNNILSLRPIP